MSTLLDRAASVLERRFLKNAFLPVLLFFPAVFAPLGLSSGLDRWAAVWEAQSLNLKVIEVVGYLAVTWFVAAIVASQWRNIIRLYEGYPLELVPWLDRYAKGWHGLRRWHIERGLRRGTPYYDYAKEAESILPTRLGNRLLASERGPFERYGAETIFLWPRMVHVIPREVVRDVDETRATLEFLLVISLWFALFGVCSVVILSFAGAPVLLIGGCFVGGLAFAYGVYLSALPAAMEYGEQLRTAVELYRLDLLERLKLGVPQDVKTEKSLWSSYRQYVYARVHPMKLSYPSHALTYVPPVDPSSRLDIGGPVRVVLADERSADAQDGSPEPP